MRCIKTLSLLLLAWTAPAWSAGVMTPAAATGGHFSPLPYPRMTACTTEAFIPATAIPASYFGMSLLSNAAGNWPAGITFEQMGKSIFETWAYLEREEGVFTWTDLDAHLDLAALHSSDFLYSFNYFPPHATSDPESCFDTSLPPLQACSGFPTDLTKIDAMVTALVEHVRDRNPAMVRIYELMNEPETQGILYQDLITWNNRVVPLIRTLDPAALILLGSMNSREPPWSTYWTNYFDNGGTTAVDGYTIHSYTGFANGAEPESVDINYAWTGPSVTTSSLQTWAVLRAALVSRGLLDKPVWNTEGSWGPVGGGAAIPADEDIQASWVARHLALNWSNGITRFYWYAWPVQSWGQLKDKQGATAYDAMRGWISGASMPTPCAVSGTVWTCPLRRSAGYAGLLVWDARWSNITGAADNGSGLIRLTVKNASGLTTGDSVTVSTVAGTTEANGTWTVTVINSTTIDLQGSTFANTYTSGGAWVVNASYTVPSAPAFRRMRTLAGTTTTLPENRLITIGVKPLLLECGT